MSIKNVIQDFLCVYGLTVLAGVIVGLFGGERVPYFLPLVNCFATFAGFYMIVYWATDKGLKYFCIVAFLLWLSGGLNVLHGMDVMYWLASIAIIYPLMLLAWWSALKVRGRDGRHKG